MITFTTLLVFVIIFFALIWHDEPARPLLKRSDRDLDRDAKGQGKREH